jgi:GGDEF domain-containing protein
LAVRLLDTVSTRTSPRGTPLRVAIGTAVCPEDGREPAMLAAHADVGLYAARSAVRASAHPPATPVDESA